MTASEMYIHLKGMKFYAFHGVLPQETIVGAEYTLDLRLKTDFSKAAETDDLAQTMNYASVYQSAKAEMNIPSQLLEHVAYRIARRLFQEYPTLQETNITLFKQNPPMGADGKHVGIEITYLR